MSISRSATEDLAAKGRRPRLAPDRLRALPATVSGARSPSSTSRSRRLAPSLPFVSLALAALLLPASAQGEATATGVVTRMPTSGLDQPATSAALADGPEAIVINPGGVGFQRRLALRYLHETGPEPGGGLASSSGDGVYLGGRLFGSLGLGVAMEWLRPKDSGDPSFVNYRRTSWSLSLGGEVLAIGATAHVFSDGLVDDRATWDLGLMTRPSRYLSVGLVVRDVDGPSALDSKIPRRYVAAVAARPFGDWLSLAVDAEVLGGENPAIDNGFGSMALGYTLRARVFDGVTILGALSHRLDAETPLVIQAGLQLDSSWLSLYGTPLIQTRGENAGFLVGADLRAADVPTLGPAKGSQVAVIDVAQALAPPSGLQLFAGSARDPVLDFVLGLQRLAEDDSIGAVILELRGLDLGMGQVFELRRAIEDFRGAGKETVALLYAADDASYYLATAANRIYATPDAALLINGFSSSATFLHGPLQTLGIHVDVAKVGAYKNAPDTFTRSEISKEQQEVMRSILDDIFPRYVEAVAKARDLPPETFRALLDRGLLTAQEAADGGLIDRVLFPDELKDELSQLLHRRAHLRPVTPAAAPWTQWGPPPEIAVIPIEGTITGGYSSGGFVPITGARTVVQAIEDAARDPQIRAIVLRIDSGGGDAGGSLLIWRAVLRAREQKPVIASMSGAAASGGYLAAVGAERIFAAPDTLTGSIGVFWIKPSFEKTLELLKIGSYREHRGEQAEIESLAKPWSEAEQASAQRYVDAFYQQFIEATAAGRDLEVAEVERLARGRVWTGAQARERDLVDELGGLPEALLAARQAAGLSPDEPVRHRVYGGSEAFLQLGGGGSIEVDRSLRPGIADLLPEPLQEAILAKIPAPLLVENPSGLWAVAPFQWKPR